MGEERLKQGRGGIITDRQLAIFDGLVFWFIRRAMRRRFFAVLTRGLKENLARVDSACPLILAATHTNWWDGFVARLISQEIRKIKPDGILMQEQRHLRRYWFFRFMGVFGIDLENPAPGIRYALKRLSDPSVHLFMFPQGRLARDWEPLELRPGAELLTRRSGAQVIPMVIRYEWLIESKPSIIVLFSQPIEAGQFSTEHLRDQMIALRHAADEDLRNLKLESFDELLPPRLSINRRFEQIMHWCRGKKPGNFEKLNR